MIEEYLEDYEYERVYIINVRERMERLLSGDIDMASFAEPTASYAELQGATKWILEDSKCVINNMLVFREAFIQAYPEVLQDFHAVYNDNVQRINDNPEFPEMRLIILLN